MIFQSTGRGVCNSYSPKKNTVEVGFAMPIGGQYAWYAQAGETDDL